jgi:hypothetical protein
MKRPGIDVELSGHTRLNETLRVLDILVYKKIERTDGNVSPRQFVKSVARAAAA